jgi:acetyl esterase/lipase
MPLHPSAETMLTLMSEFGLELGPDTTPEDARARMDAARAARALPVHPVYDVEDRTIPGPAGPISVRVYRPSDADALPVLVWFHGGGWVLGGLDSHDPLCRQLCDDSRLLVLSVDYRLAPEAKFPAAFDDCVAAWSWVAEHAAEVGGDPTRAALGGDSAGGNLAAATTLAVRDLGLPLPRCQVFVYPVTDYEFDTPSMLDNATGYFLETGHVRWFSEHYARTADDFADWRFSPLRAPDVSRLPPTMVVTAEFDPLRDQGEAYGRRLEGAGVPVDVVCTEGVFHGFFGMHASIEPAKVPWDKAIALLRTTTAAG